MNYKKYMSGVNVGVSSTVKGLEESLATTSEEINHLLWWIRQ